MCDHTRNTLVSHILQCEIANWVTLVGRREQFVSSCSFLVAWELYFLGLNKLLVPKQFLYFTFSPYKLFSHFLVPTNVTFFNFSPYCSYAVMWLASRLKVVIKHIFGARLSQIDKQIVFLAYMISMAICCVNHELSWEVLAKWVIKLYLSMMIDIYFCLYMLDNKKSMGDV